MHDRHQLVEERIGRELIERLLPRVHVRSAPLTVLAGPGPDDLAPFAVGTEWGAPWQTTWFRVSGDVPAEWAPLVTAGDRLEAIVDLGFNPGMAGFQCEGLVRLDDGTPVQGIHPRRTAVPVAGMRVDLLIEAASNPSFRQFAPSPLGRLATAGDAPLYRFARADVVVVDPEAEALVHDLDVLNGVMRTLALADPRRARQLRHIERALDLFAATGDPGAARRALEPSLTAQPGDRTHRVIATGHAHIDSAWLWPIRETHRKCVRTFTSAVGMMDADPDYRFVCSQAQQYEWVREDEPGLFDRIAGHVAGGQFVPVGGMWVEPDMNLPSGESLVRQIVFGQRYFEEQFGVRCTEVWIPDVFGYPAGLPQVFAAGGMRRFVTQKLSWNRTNRFPHHTFWWEGLDGTRVLTHFPPVDTYNAEVVPGELAHSVERFSEHAWSDWSLMPFGHGDGGGGPTREMLERARRVADLDGAPRVQIGTPAEFFGHVEAELEAGAEAPVWRGELYFETHRGTLTSQLRTKEGNRQCERLLREIELLDAWAAARGETVSAGAHEELWREVLTQQFHDIIPGSSIGWVHDDAEAILGRVADDLERRIDARLADCGAVVVNTATRARREVVISSSARPIGEGAVVQDLGADRVAFVVDAPALGVGALSPIADSAHGVVVTDRSMSNGRLAVSWGLDGALNSVIDEARGRELLAGPAAVLELAVDQPVLYDAWDVESWTVAGGVALGEPDRVDIEAVGPLVGIVAVHHRFGPSTAVIRYVLRAGSPRLDVEITLDWHHQEHLLSMRFPLDVHTDSATCGIQFGAIRRPMHASTSWDAAKFEVCAHRYVDVAEPDFGVAVLNNGRYGHGLLDGQVRVSLARGARYPDPDADQGHHQVTLALLPHGAGLGEVTTEAENLAYPLRVVGHGVAEVDGPVAPVQFTAPAGVEVDAVKLADDGSGDVIVRLHEGTGSRAGVTVAISTPVVRASACDLLEAPERALDVSDGIVALMLRPFELVTLRLTGG